MEYSLSLGIERENKNNIRNINAKNINKWIRNIKENRLDDWELDDCGGGNGAKNIRKICMNTNINSMEYKIENV